MIVHGGDILEISPGKRDHGVQPSDKEIYWQDPGQTRAVRNIGKTAIEFVEFELK